MRSVWLTMTLLASTAKAAEIRELRIAPGASSVKVSGAVVRGARDVYAFGARKGQQAELSISAVEFNAVFAVWLPGARLDPASSAELQGRALRGADELADAKHWRGALPESGRYLVVVGPTRGNATYELTLTLTPDTPGPEGRKVPPASPACNFVLSCSHRGSSFALALTSQSGECTEDDLALTQDGAPVEGLAKAWYLPIGNVGPLPPVCRLADGQGYPAFALDDARVLLILEKSGRPGYDVLSAAVLDVKQRRLVSTLELGESKNKAIAVLATGAGVRVRVVKEHLSEVRCDCDAAFVEAWKELRFVGGKLEARWLGTE